MSENKKRGRERKDRVATVRVRITGRSQAGTHETEQVGGEKSNKVAELQMSIHNGVEVEIDGDEEER